MNKIWGTFFKSMFMCAWFLLYPILVLIGVLFFFSFIANLFGLW